MSAFLPGREGVPVLLHLGRGVSIQGESLISLTDLQREHSPEMQGLIERMRASGLLRTLGPAPKTLVICRDPRRRGRCVYYLSCVGLRTLRARAGEAAAWQRS